MEFKTDIVPEYNELMYTPGPMDRIINPQNLHQAFLQCKKEVEWKNSVQNYQLNELSNIVDIISRMSDYSYTLSGSYEFTLNERGHLRYIKALSILDRVIQRSFNDNILNPAINNYLIYDNGASRVGKGISFSRERFVHHLQQAYYKFGYNSYILLIDFSKYFDNILHEVILMQFKPLMSDEEFWFIQQTFSSFELDVSYMSDEEYMNYKDNLFNMLDYNMINKELLTGEKMMKKSVGIGNQTSQASGIFYPHEIDNYCKIVKGIKYYGRYMDDTYIIAKTKEELRQILKEITSMCSKLGIHINPNKTRIQPLSSKISYLKINHTILSTGKVLKIVPSSTFIREIHRISKFKKLLDEGRMSMIDILQCFVSWRGSYLKFDSCQKVYEIELLFRSTFKISADADLLELLKDLNKKEKEKVLNKKLINTI